MSSIQSNDLSNIMFRMCDLTLESKENISSIKEYENQPLVSLEKSIKPLISLIPDIQQMISHVQQNYHKTKDNLTKDESQSIMLYTLEWKTKENSFYYILNQNLHEINHEKFKPWLLYLRLFIYSLSKLPTINNKIIYRGIKYDLTEQFPKGKIFHWCAFISCTTSIETLQDYLGSNGSRTIFNIECNSAKDISHYSFDQLGKEILIYPIRKFQVISSLDTGNQLKIIHLKEIIHSSSSSSSSSSSQLTTTTISKSIKKYENDNLLHLIQQCQNHSKIFLREKNLTDDDIIIIVKETIINKQCKELFLGINQLTSISISIIAKALNNNINLKLLDLSQNPIGDLGIQSLTKILELNHSHLQYLYLYSTGITDDGVEDLGHMLKTNTNLLDLDLGDNDITIQGIQILANVLTNINTTLTALSLKNNKLINDDSMDYFIQILEHNQSLKFLNLEKCNLSTQNIEQLQQISQTKKRFRLQI